MLEELEKMSTSSPNPRSPQTSRRSPDRQTDRQTQVQYLHLERGQCGKGRYYTATMEADGLTSKRTEAGIDGSKAAFDKTVTSARWLGTSGLRYFLPFWYAKSPMFWLPHGWFPYYAEWIISFPRAPMGSVSVASWQLACTGVITLVVDTITAVLSLVAAAMQGKQGKQAEKPVRASPAAPTTGSEKSQGEEDSSKKEL